MPAATTAARKRTSTSRWVLAARRSTPTPSSPSPSSFLAAASRVSPSPSCSISLSHSGGASAGGAAADATDNSRPDTKRANNERMAASSAAQLPHAQFLVEAGRDGVFPVEQERHLRD